MYDGLAKAGYQLAGWTFGMWDFDWWRRPEAGRLADRLARKGHPATSLSFTMAITPTLTQNAVTRARRFGCWSLVYARSLSHSRRCATSRIRDG